MNSTQQILFRLMKDFDDICTRHGVEYVLIGGSALGAVRHGGFIPWDDDVDILVDREEFIKLDEAMNKESLVDRAWITEDNTPAFHNPLGKFFDTSTTDLHRSLLLDGSPNGHHLEVFIADPYPNNEEQRKLHNKYLWLYTELQNPYFPSANLGMPDGMLDKELLEQYQKKAETDGLQAALAEIRDHLSHPEEECDSICQRWSYRPVVFKKAWLKDKTRIKFESAMFPVGKDAIRRFTVNYDEFWNILPSKKNRVTHDGFDSESFSCLDKQDEVNNFLADCNYAKLLEQNKVDRRERTFSDNEQDRCIAEIRFAYLCVLAGRFEQESWNFKYEELDYHLERFSNFFNIQFYNRFIKFGHRIPLRDDLLEAMVMTLIFTNRIGKAILLLDLHSESALYGKLREICNWIMEMKIEKYSNGTEKVKEYLQLLDSVPDIANQVEYTRARLWLIAQEADNPNYESIRRTTQSYAHLDDAEVQKYIGDLYYRAGDIFMADRYYKKILRQGQNGIIVKDLRELGFFDGAEVQQHTLQALDLLKRFNKICRKNAIPYIVSGVLAKVVYSRNLQNLAAIQVFMKSEDMLKFVEYVEEHPSKNFTLEHYGTNPRYPFFTVRYVDKRTTLIDSTQSLAYRKCGINIEIVPIRSIDRKPSCHLRIKEQAKMLFDSEYAVWARKGIPWPKRMILKLFRGQPKDESALHKGRKLLEDLCRSCNPAPDSAEFCVVLPGIDSSRKVLAASMLGRVKHRPCLDCKIRLPRKIGAYIEALYRTEDGYAYPNGTTAATIALTSVAYNAYKVKNAKTMLKKMSLDNHQIAEREGKTMKRIETIEAAWEKVRAIYDEVELKATGEKR